MVQISFVFRKCLDQFSFLSSGKLRYLTVSEESICLLFKKIEEYLPDLCVNIVWIDFDSFIFMCL